MACQERGANPSVLPPNQATPDLLLPTVTQTATREIEAKRMQLSQRNQELTHSLATRTRELEQTQRQVKPHGSSASIACALTTPIARSITAQLLQERSARQEAEAALKQASHSAEAHEALSARCDALEEV